MSDPQDQLQFPREVRPATLDHTLRQEMVGQCIIASQAWGFLKALKDRGPPRVLNGHYRSNTPEGKAVILEQLEYHWGLLGGVQTMLVSSEIISRILFEVDPRAKCRVRDQPLLVVCKRFPELADLNFYELKRRLPRDAFVHLHGKIPHWYGEHQTDPPIFLAAWGYGKGPAPETNYRFLDWDTWTVTAQGDSCRLDKLHDEMQLLVDRIPIVAGVSGRSVE